jgi:hypothetical protein
MQRNTSSCGVPRRCSARTRLDVAIATTVRQRRSRTSGADVHGAKKSGAITSQIRDFRGMCCCGK